MTRSRHADIKTQFSFRDDYPAALVTGLTSLSRVAVPRFLRLLAALVALTIIVTAAGLYFIPWVQTTSGLGRVTTLDPRDRLQEISATVGGRLAQWYVRDGDPVIAGAPIARIEDIDQQLVDRLVAQRDAAQRKYEAARDAVATAELDYQRKRALFDEGLASRLDFEQARIRVQQLKVTEQEAAAAVNEADVNLSRQGSQLVVAPRDGTIVQVAAGDTATMINAGQRLVSFLPADAERAVEVFIDGRDIGLVHPGRAVRLQFEGWPAFQFSGVPQYAIGTFSGTVAFVDPSARADGRFRVLVTETADRATCNDQQLPNRLRIAGNCGWPPESFIRLGANARAFIQLETVPLGFELWRRLNNFPPVNVPAAPAGEASR
ncbi:MAG: HlyD family efflux transporter periplasmic adaptor subunit [Gammaproteobacteria bacterium]|nr:HlyD family efflux transporter periplasmic adaptor subunit [Gammaproteobacteria bacterium]